MLITISEERDVEERKQVLTLLRVRSSDYDNELLLCLRAKFQSDSLSQFL